MESLLIKFETYICLRSKITLKYFEYDNQTQTANSCSPPPSIDPLQSQKISKFKILEQKESKQLKIKSKQIKDHLTFGCKIHLVNDQGEYLTYSSKSQLKFDKPSLDEGLNSMLYKTATWTVLDLTNSLSKKSVSIYDDVCLKNVYGTYLLCLENGEVNTSGNSINISTTWNVMKADVPYIPSWLYERPPFNKFMNLNPQSSRSISFQHKKNIGFEKPNIQQLLLIEDLLDVMLGYDGVYIKKVSDSFEFKIEPHLEIPSCSMALVQLTAKILDMPTYYYHIEHYISINSIQQGTVCQALCGGLRVLVKQYKMMVVQLDQQAKSGLTLQKLWYFIQHSLKIMKSLFELVKEAQKFKGGQLISCILKVLNNTTDEQVIDIYYFLLAKTMKIYLQMVSKWIYEGVIEDKNEQFMIMVDKKSSQKQWLCWEERYCLRRQQIPIIFQKDSHLILITGKYLNIIKQCKQITNKDNPMFNDIQNNINKYIKQQDFGDFIFRAYQWANKQLQSLIFQEYKLQMVLKSMKGYFFLQYGDLFVHFMELAEPYLSELKNSKVADSKLKSNQFSPAKLQSLFQLVIRTSSANNDPYNDDIFCKIDSSSLYEQLHRIKILQPQTFTLDFNQKPYMKKQSRYLDYFTIDFKCQFPLNLIINKKSISKYQTLFRFMFWCKYTERQLNNIWLILQSTRLISMKCYSQAYLLNQKMINYIKNLIYYLSYQIIQHNWHTFMDNLKRVQNFQDIMQYHDQFLNKSLNQSLLMSNKLLPIITNQLGTSCQNFISLKAYLSCIVPSNVTIHANINETLLQQKRKKQEEIANLMKQYTQANNFQEIIKGFYEGFDNSMKKLLRQVYSMVGKQQSHLIGFLDRLDQLKYYNRKFFSNITDRNFREDI